MAYNHLMLGENLYQLRMEKSLSILSLSELVGASESSLRAIESGHRFFSIKRLCTVANRLNVSMDNLLKKQSKAGIFVEEQQSEYGSDESGAGKLSESNIFMSLTDRIEDADTKELIYHLTFSILYEKNLESYADTVSEMAGFDLDACMGLLSKYITELKID